MELLSRLLRFVFKDLQRKTSSENVCDGILQRKSKTNKKGVDTEVMQESNVKIWGLFC